MYNIFILIPNIFMIWQIYIQAMIPSYVWYLLAQKSKQTIIIAGWNGGQAGLIREKGHWVTEYLSIVKIIPKIVDGRHHPKWSKDTKLVSIRTSIVTHSWYHDCHSKEL